ncbi:MAG: hypothetical protein V1787_06470, partial [Candidatus Micrarchaeota archaeon]
MRAICFLLLLVTLSSPAMAACALDGSSANSVITIGLVAGVRTALIYDYDVALSAFGAARAINEVNAISEYLGGYWDFDGDGDFDIVTYSYAFRPTENKADFTIYLYAYDVSSCLVKTTAFTGVFDIQKGTFSECSNNPNYEWCNRVAFGIADVDHANGFDYIFGIQGTQRYSGRLYAALNDGSGHAALAPSFASLASVSHMTRLTLAEGDYNEDGQADVLILDYSSPNCAAMPVRFVKGLPSPPYFENAPAISTFIANRNPSTMFNAGDRLGDGHLDTFYGLDDDGDVGQLWERQGNGDGTFGAAELEVLDTAPLNENVCPYGAGFQGGNLALRDFDLDGIPDGVICLPSLNSLSFVRGPLSDSAWASREDVGSCVDQPLVGPTYLCKQQYQQCAQDADCCGTGQGYPFDQSCSFQPPGNPVGHCCPVGQEWNPATGDCESTNAIPVAIADSATGPAGTPLTLDGSSSIDSDGSITGYFWTLTSGDLTGCTPPAVLTTAAIELNCPAPNSLIYSLVVTDDDGAPSVSAQATATFQNRAPVAVITVIGSPATLPGVVSVGGSGSTDPDAGQ